jgi:opacity protein-like surface antigen
MKKLLYVFGLITACTAFAAAQDKGTIETGVYFPALSSPIFGTWAKVTAPSLESGFYGDYYFQKNISIGAEFAYYFGYATIASDDSITGFRLCPQFKYGGDTILFGRNGHYYSVLGMGVYHDSLDGNGDTNFGFSLGEGLKVDMGKGWDVGLEARWHHVFSDPAGNNLDLLPNASYRF